MINKRIASFRYAFKGLYTLVKTQPHARFHLLATLCVIALAYLLNVSRMEWAVLVLAIGAVWSAEALNTGLEFLADRVAPEWHELVGNAKDVAAGGVLVISISAAVAGLLIFLPHII